MHGSYVPNILPGLMLVAFGVGPAFVGVTAAANAGATASQAGLVAAIMNSSQQVGGAIGLAIFSAIARSRTTHLLATGAGVHTAATAGFDQALLAGAVFAAAAAVISLRTTNTHQDPIEEGYAAPAHYIATTPAPTAGSSPSALAIGPHPTQLKDRGADMTTDNTDRSVLLLGRSQLVLDETVAGLHELGYEAEATNDFADITGRYDVEHVDLVMFGGQVPPERKAELRDEIGATNPQIMFVQGLAGIPGLIVNQGSDVVSGGAMLGVVMNAMPRQLRGLGSVTGWLSCACRTAVACHATR